MTTLLRSNFHRLLKDKVFWICAAFSAAEAIFMSVIAKTNQMDGSGYISIDALVLTGFGFGGLAVPGLLMGICCTLFVGKEYACGTIRNKLIVGKKREAVWTANFISCITVGLCLEVSYMLAALAFGLPMLGGFSMPAETLILRIATGTLMMISYAAIINAVTMLSRNQTAAIIINLVTVVVVGFLSAILINRINEPEFWETGDGDLIRNNSYPGPALRAFYQFVLDLLPSGQSTQLSATFSYARTWQPPVYSLCLIACVNAAGVAFFRRLDLK